MTCIKHQSMDFTSNVESPMMTDRTMSSHLSHTQEWSLSTATGLSPEYGKIWPPQNKQKALKYTQYWVNGGKWNWRVRTHCFSAFWLRLRVRNQRVLKNQRTNQPNQRTNVESVMVKEVALPAANSGSIPVTYTYGLLNTASSVSEF